MISRLYPTIVMQHKLARFRFRRNKTSTGKEFFVRVATLFGLSQSGSGMLTLTVPLIAIQ